MNSYSLTKQRTIQWLIIILVLLSVAGSYFYYRSRGATEVVDNRPSFEAPLITSIELERGVGAPTFTRADGADRRATVTDFEGLIRKVKAGEARFEGTRRVENMFTGTHSMSGGFWLVSSLTVTPNAATAPDGTATASILTATGNNARLSVLYPSTTGMHSLSLYLKRRTGTGPVSLSFRGIQTEVVDVTTEWQRFHITRTGGASVLANIVTIDTSGDEVYAWGAQLESVVGQTNQNPSEYVSMGVKSAPYHGAGVDGVKYFDTENGNTAASNVVTEVVGDPIDPDTLRGYLAEGSRTNLALQSEVFGTTWVTGNASVSSNVAAAPDGSLTADKLVENGSTAEHTIGQNISMSAGTPYAMSLYVKSAERSSGTLQLRSTDSAHGGGVTYNLLTGSLSAPFSWGTAITVGATSITELINDWYQVTVTVTSSTGGANTFFVNLSNGGPASYAGDGSSGLYLWGAQMETASFASSYIPTTSASVTRARDVLSYPTAGNYSATPGTVYTEITVPSADTVNARRVIRTGTSGASSSDPIIISGVNALQARDGSSHFPTSALSITPGSTTSKVAHSWSGTSAGTMFLNGSSAALSGSYPATYDGSFAAGTSIFIGNSTSDATSLFGNVKNVKIWEKALSDDELEALTAGEAGVVRETNTRTANNTGLVGYWSFDDERGDHATDFSGNNNTGTLTNMDVSTGWVPGRVGTALDFDGTDDHVQLPDAAFDFLGEGTISAWIKFPAKPAASSSAHIFGAASSTTANALFIWNVYSPVAGDTRLRLGSNMNTNYVYGSTSLEADTWYHVAATSDGTVTRLYVDGELQNLTVQSGTNTGKWIASSVSGTMLYSWGVTRRSTGDIGYWSGQIDEGRVYDHALSQTEIIALREASAGVKVNHTQNEQVTDNLVGLWSFNGPDVSGTTAYDRSGQGNDGTLISGPTPAIGKVGQALSFDGSGDYVDLTAHVADLNFSGAGSVTFWVKSTSDVSQRPWALSQGANTNDYFSIAIGDSTTGVLTNELITIHKYLNGTNQYILGYTTAARSELFDGNWHHVAIVWSGSATVIYLDGTSKTKTVGLGTDNGQYGGVGGADEVNIGSMTTAGVRGSYMNGSLDEVRVYDTALSASDIANLYNLGR